LGDEISSDAIITAKYCQSETKDANLPKNRRAMQVKNSLQGVVGGRDPVIDPMEYAFQLIHLIGCVKASLG
jgi:hypothetical protein